MRSIGCGARCPTTTADSVPGAPGRVSPNHGPLVDRRGRATGPSSFDCSGFVWSIYQSAGLGFERASARTLWSRFAAPDPEEQYKFGTLVFFSNLAHVGIVADEKGFYHASRHHGVVYSPFNEYWLKRIDGFRKVPVTVPVSASNSPILASGSVPSSLEH